MQQSEAADFFAFFPAVLLWCCYYQLTSLIRRVSFFILPVLMDYFFPVIFVYDLAILIKDNKASLTASSVEKTFATSGLSNTIL
jgi:hypothetical protein